MSFSRIDFKPEKKKKRNPRFLLLIIIVAGIILIKLSWNSIFNSNIIERNIAIEKEYIACSQDSDCTAVQSDYCHCSRGGSAISINKSKKNLWLVKKTTELFGQECGFVASVDISCRAYSKCIRGTCQLVKP